MDQQLLDVFAKHGYHDNLCNKIIFGDSVPENTPPGVREFYQLLRKLLTKVSGHKQEREFITVALFDPLLTIMGAHYPCMSCIFTHLFIQDGDVKEYSLEDWSFPTTKLSMSKRLKLMMAFVMLNLLKAFRSMTGIKLGPAFIDHIAFPIWRPAIWTSPKVPKYFGYVGVAHPEVPKGFHPVDISRSSRYHNGLMIRECPTPHMIPKENYQLQHRHGLQGLAKLMTMSFIDIDSSKRICRYYTTQGCTRMYRWQELVDDPRALAEIKSKIIIRVRTDYDQSTI